MTVIGEINFYSCFYFFPVEWSDSVFHKGDRKTCATWYRYSALFCILFSTHKMHSDLSLLFLIYLFFGHDFVCIMTSCVAEFIVFNSLAVAKDVSVMDLLRLFQQFYHLLTFAELLQLDLVWIYLKLLV